MASTLKFVDSIASSPTTRLDLNDRSTWRLEVDGTEFPPPPLQRAIAQTLLSDGGTIPATAYDLRTLRLRLSTYGTADGTATQLQNLFRELDRPRNILQWLQETTNPIFFRTFRSTPDAVQEIGRYDGTKRQMGIELLAEPFGYGLLETPVSGATLNRDPANASNGTWVDVTGVKGDVETPALIKMPAGVAGRVTLIATRRRGTPANAPWLFQAESLTQGTDTATQTNDANFSGSSNNYSRTTPGTTSMVTRISTQDIGTAGVDLRGRYHVYLRYRKNTSGDGWNIRLLWGASGGTTTTNATFATPATTNICIADLGEIQIPRGWDPVYDGRSGTELSVSDVYQLNVQAQRASGSGTIDWDFLRLVPIDDRSSTVTFAEASSDHWWLDAEDNSARGENSSNQVETVAYPTITGNLPMLSPGQTNRLHVLYEIGSGLAYALTTQTISVAYYPRYLYVRPAST